MFSHLSPIAPSTNPFVAAGIAPAAAPTNPFQSNGRAAAVAAAGVCVLVCVHALAAFLVH